ncbi:molybdate ABC transporter substrate-binding protein [Aliiroseovarius sp.]|uniref:molybdate ABC transporter substrate-binding protein n=1 Tax=Aliiroseovarius sp. TaxID=1872442 RepID=UPI003BA9A5C0
MRHLLALLLILFTTPLWAGEVTVFAAASMKTALDRISEGFEAATGHRVTRSHAGSSALARQIQLGAPADVFISANPGWMDALEEGGLIAAETRFDLVGNRLVLVGREAAEPVEITAGFDLIAQLGDGRLAMALVEAVPVGIYGKAALENLGLWDQIAGQVAQSDNARTALALVAVGAAPLGVVYATDATADPRVSVVATFRADSHPPITYPVAATVTARPETAAFLAWLKSSDAQKILTEEGFTEVSE